MHAKYGGIVPEIASRQHLFSIVPAISSVLENTGMDYDDIDAVAVTNGPGLAGSLLVGVNFAKGIAFAKDVMVAGINHLEGHIYSAWLGDKDPEVDPGFPLLCLIASGGHTVPQAPQSMQSDGSMTCNSLRSPLIAFVGQRFVQAVHPIQVSIIL